jgi:hypothetical protein
VHYRYPKSPEHSRNGFLEGTGEEELRKDRWDEFFLCVWYWGLNSKPIPQAIPPTLFCERFFKIGSHELFAWAGFELQFS